MKKIIAIIGVFATIFAFASCKKLTPEEADASREAARLIAISKYEKKLEESLKHEEEIYVEKSKTVAELGKTEPGNLLCHILFQFLWIKAFDQHLIHIGIFPISYRLSLLTSDNAGFCQLGIDRL